MIDIFNSDAFATVTLSGKVMTLPYKPGRIGEMKLFDEQPIATTGIAIEYKDGLLTMIGASPRGSAGDFIGDQKGRLYSFTAQHLRRNAKVFADEVQNVRTFGTEDTAQTIEAKRDEKLAILRAMHEVTWEYHRVGALTGRVLDADGTTELLNLFTAFNVAQNTYNLALTTTSLDVRAEAEAVADKIDDELGASTYDRIHVFCGVSFYDTIIKHKFVQDYLKQIAASGDTTLISDLRGGTRGFTIGPLTFERARRWRVKNAANSAMVDMIGTDEAYAFPVNPAPSENGPMFIGRFAPQPFMDTVNRLNPPLVVKAVMDPAQQFIDLLGVSCPLYLNTRPRAVVKLTKS